jgi:hypothetical protein
MTDAKPTPGPVRVHQPERWPFPVEIIRDEPGEEVDRKTILSMERFGYSTDQNSVSEVMAGTSMGGDARLARKKNAEQVANADLWAEATNTHHETGLTPRQLAEQRAELLEALQRLVSEAVQAEYDGSPLMAEMPWDEIVSARTAIATARASEREGGAS